MQTTEKDFIGTFQEMLTYTYTNAVTFYSPERAGYNFPMRLPLKDIVVTKGNINFFLEDGRSFCIKDKSIVRNIHPDKKKHSTNKYKSYWGQKSILKHHSISVVPLKGFTFGLSEKVDSFSINGNITECIHDGATTFIINENVVQHLTPQPIRKKVNNYVEK